MGACISPYYNVDLNMTFFDILKDIITIKSGTLHEQPEFNKAFDKFIVMRFLSMHPTSYPVVEELNVYSKQKNISDEDFYLILVKKVPYNRSNFIKYIKKPKSPKVEVEE